MSQTLSNGYKVPDNGDFGDSWFPDMEDNIQRLNDHTHNGTDSNKLPSTSVSAVSASISVSDFALQPDGRFRAITSIPAGGVFDELQVIYRDPSTKEQMYLSYEKLSTNQFYTYINIVQAVDVVYLS